MEREYIDKLAFIDIKDKRVLMVRNAGKDVWLNAGGKREIGESDAQAVVREMKEELSVDVDPESLVQYGVFAAHAHGKPEHVFVRITCYTGSYAGELRPSMEVEAYEYMSYDKRSLTSETGQQIFDDLKEKGLIE